MRRRASTAIFLILLILLALAACSVAPRGKTVVVERTRPPHTASPTAEGSIQFNLAKRKTLTMKNLDQSGYFNPAEPLVFGWLDDDHLLAIGVKPVNTEGSTDSNAEANKIRAAKQAGVLGLTGQILALDWDTGETTELYTVQDEVITSLGLSHDKSKLWYCSTGSDGSTKLSVSDISFKHSLLEVDFYYGYQPVWSDHDLLLGFQSDKVLLNIFDGVNTTTYVNTIMSHFNQMPLSILDDTGEIVTMQRDGLLSISNFQQDVNKQGVYNQDAAIVAPYIETAYDAAYKATMAGGDILLYLAKGINAFELKIQNIRTLAVGGSFDGILNYALSDDQKYICLVKETEDSSADVYVGQWHEGQITNQKLVYKGFVASGNIYFSPDNTKLYMEGVYNYLEMDTIAMILNFK